MGALIGIVSLLVVLALGLVVSRVASVALEFTGLSRDLARFQAQSAFMGVGFTTSESERVIDHPVRRRIIWWLMLFGNAGLIASVSALIPVFMTSGEGAMGFGARLVWLASGLVLLWAISASKWLDRLMYRVIKWALKNFTALEVSDYPSLLQFSAGYTITEIKVEPGDWLAGKTLMELRLPDEGIQVLGIRRPDGEYIGTPAAGTFVRKGDMLVIYGRLEHVAELHKRRADTVGDFAHAHRVQERHRAMVEAEAKDRQEGRDSQADPNAVPANMD